MQMEENIRFFHLIQIGAPVPPLDEEGMQQECVYVDKLKGHDPESLRDHLQFATATKVARCSREQAAFEAPAIAVGKSPTEALQQPAVPPQQPASVQACERPNTPILPSP